MTPTVEFDPEAYMAALFERQAELGAEYVRRQVEWAESILQDRLKEKSSSVSGACAPGERQAAASGLSPSAARPVTVAKERNAVHGFDLLHC